jgi:hypothetical protein
MPVGYWYFCTIIDPILSLSAAYMHYFSPSSFMDPGFARDSRYAIIMPSNQFLMHQFGGVFVAWAFLMLTMLRETTDIKVWTRFQTALAFTDVAVLYSQWKALEAQRRLELSKLRWEESSDAILVVILLIRLGFVSGWDFPKRGAAKKRQYKMYEVICQSGYLRNEIEKFIADWAGEDGSSGSSTTDSVVHDLWLENCKVWDDQCQVAWQSSKTADAMLVTSWLSLKL